MKDVCVRSFERAFYARIGPETVWFKRSRNCPGGSLGGFKT